MNKTIMIIEDDVETQFLFSQLLESEGFNVITKSNGVEALSYLEKSKCPDLIFMDLNFPGGTPEQFVAALNELIGEKKVPIILVSGKSDIEEYAARLQATNYIKKPFEIDPLLNLIGEVI